MRLTFNEALLYFAQPLDPGSANHHMNAIETVDLGKWHVRIVQYDQPVYTKIYLWKSGRNQFI